jgi:hypothetical protein
LFSVWFIEVTLFHVTCSTFQLCVGLFSNSAGSSLGYFPQLHQRFFFYRQQKQQLDASGLWYDWHLAERGNFCKRSGCGGEKMLSVIYKSPSDILLVMLWWLMCCLPLYYRLNLTSIYDYLKTRLGFTAYKTGAGFFIVSRTLGATARLYLVVKILQDAILESFGVPFWVTTLVILIMILLYTYEGGVKTIVWTDTLQTTCMLGGLVYLCHLYSQQPTTGFISAGFSKWSRRV